MALRPLTDSPQKDNGTPLDGGINVRGAQNYIEQLLDDDGKTVDHIDQTQGEQSNRDSSEGMPANAPIEDDNQNQNQNQDQDPIDESGDTSQEEGGDINEGDTDNGSDIQAESKEQEAAPITNLSELAEALEVTVDDLKSSLTHTFKAAGEERTVTLSDLETGYQLQADYDRSKGKLAEQQQALEQEHTSRVDSYHEQSTALADMMRVAEQMVISDYNSPAMQQLRTSDPAEWSAKQREGEYKLQQLGQARQGAAARYSQVMQDEQNSFLAREGAKLSSSVDGWNDGKLKNAVDTIKTLGFNDNEVVGIADSRLIKGALELQTLRAENEELKARMAKADKTVSKIKQTVPKTITAGKLSLGNKSINGITPAKINKIRKRLNSSGSVSDAAALIETML